MHVWKLHPWVASAIAANVFLWPGSTSFAEGATGCAPGQNPGFRAGFAALKSQIGQPVGDPTTCEYPDPKGTGDVEQNTTTGLAFWRKSTNTPTFTDGLRHWALTARGMVTWTGTSIDPPGTASAPSSGANLAKFVGTFAGHGRALTVQSDGAAFVTYRTYTWCSQGPPPCDDVQDGQIIGGGNLTIQFTSATPTVASGQIVSNTDPIYPLGAAVSLTLTTNDTVDLRLGSEDVGLFCGARAPVGYCGA